MKKLEEKIQSLETEIVELKGMVATLVDNMGTPGMVYQKIKCGGVANQAGRDMQIFNIYLNGDKQELLSLLNSVKETLPERID